MMRHACVSLAVARDGRVECHQTFEHVLRKNRFASNVLRAVARPRKPSQSDALVQSAEHKSSICDNDCEERFRSGEAMSRRADTHLFVRTSRTRPRGEDQRSSQHVRCVRRPIDGETRCQPTITDKSFQPSTIRLRRVAAARRPCGGAGKPLSAFFCSVWLEHWGVRITSQHGAGGPQIVHFHACADTASQNELWGKAE